MSITIAQVIEQAHATHALVHEHEARDLNELTEADLRELWEFCFTTYRAAEEDNEGPLMFALAEVEAAFNEPRGCPTGP